MLSERNIQWLMENIIEIIDFNRALGCLIQYAVDLEKRIRNIGEQDGVH